MKSNEDRDRDDAIRRMLSAKPRTDSFSGATIGGLVSLFEAYDAADSVFTRETNTPRIESCSTTVSLLERAYCDCCEVMQEIVAELEARVPKGGWERQMRASLLARWYAQHEDWAAVGRLTLEMLGTRGEA